MEKENDQKSVFPEILPRRKVPKSTVTNLPKRIVLTERYLAKALVPSIDFPTQNHFFGMF